MHPVEDPSHFIMVVSFSRHDFRLSDDSVAVALEDALGGSAIEFLVSHIQGKVFSFHVSCKKVGLQILALRSFACAHFKCYFHLWGNGGPNWVRELKIWRKECDAEWILISPTKRRSSLGLMAMHKAPVRSSLKSSNSTSKKLSFATFEKYSACKGYRYPATQNCIDTIVDGGYNLSAHERVVIRQPPALDLRWTVARPPIVFGTVNLSPELHRQPVAPPPDPVSVDPQIVISGNLSAQFEEAVTALIQNGCLESGPSQLVSPQSESSASQGSIASVGLEAGPSASVGFICVPEPGGRYARNPF